LANKLAFEEPGVEKEKKMVSFGSLLRAFGAVTGLQKTRSQSILSKNPI
jgi:hypothetical protein